MDNKHRANNTTNAVAAVMEERGIQRGIIASVMAPVSRSSGVDGRAARGPVVPSRSHAGRAGVRGNGDIRRDSVRTTVRGPTPARLHALPSAEIEGGDNELNPLMGEDLHPAQPGAIPPSRVIQLAPVAESQPRLVIGFPKSVYWLTFSVMVVVFVVTLLEGVLMGTHVVNPLKFPLRRLSIDAWTNSSLFTVPEYTVLEPVNWLIVGASAVITLSVFTNFLLMTCKSANFWFYYTRKKNPVSAYTNCFSRPILMVSLMAMCNLLDIRTQLVLAFFSFQSELLALAFEEVVTSWEMEYQTKLGLLVGSAVLGASVFAISGWAMSDGSQVPPLVMLIMIVTGLVYLLHLTLWSILLYENGLAFSYRREGVRLGRLNQAARAVVSPATHAIVLRVCDLSEVLVFSILLFSNVRPLS